MRDFFCVIGEFLNLKLRFFLAALVPLLVVISGLYGAVFFVLRGEYDRKMSDKAGDIASMVANEILALNAKSSEEVSAVLCYSVTNTRSVTTVEVYNGDVLVGKCNSGIETKYEFVAKGSSLFAQSKFVGRNDGRRVVVYVSDEIEIEALERLKRRFILIGLCCVLIACSFVWGLYGGIKRAINKIECSTKEFLDGDFTRVKETFDDAVLREFSRSFGDMTKLIQGKKNDFSDRMAVIQQERLNYKKSAEKANADIKMLVKRLDKALEDERRRIGLDIHDALNAVLVVVKGASQVAIRKLNEIQSNENVLAAIQSIKVVSDKTDEIYKVMRELVAELRPEVLEDFGLDVALSNLVANFNKSSVECDYFYYVCDVELPLQSYDFKIVMYRIVQECLNNVGKHARATVCSVRVSLCVDNEIECLKVEVVDDGVGFNASLVKEGIGLLGMRERAESMGGNVVVNSARGKGTVTSITVPLDGCLVKA